MQLRFGSLALAVAIAITPTSAMADKSGTLSLCKQALKTHYKDDGNMRTKVKRFRKQKGVEQVSLRVRREDGTKKVLCRVNDGTANLEIDGEPV